MSEWFDLLWALTVWFLQIGGIPIIIMAMYSAKERD